MKAVIIAAGCGSRLEEKHKGIPKSLLELKGKRLIDIILDKLVVSGINEVIVVTGYKSEMLEEAVKVYENTTMQIQCSHNSDWKRPNGISVLCAKDYIKQGEEFILLMSDHLFQQEMLNKVVQADIGSEDALLAIDFKIDNIPDIDDGMKIKCEQVDGKMYNLLEFDKFLIEYQAIDCGIFKLNTNFFTILENNIKKGKFSLSDACNDLCTSGQMKGVDIEENLWIDLDTPEMFNFNNILDKVI